MDTFLMWKKGIIIIVLFAGILLFNPWLVGNGPDYDSHYQMALTRSIGENVFSPNYAPLLPFVGSFFSTSQELYKSLIIIILGVITPLLLIGITRKWYASIFYFSISNYFYATIAGHYAEALLLVFFLSLLYFKDDRIRGLLFLIGCFSHSQAPMVLSITLLLLLINDKAKKYLFPIGACSPFWGENKPVVLKNFVYNVGYEPNSLTINDLLGVIIKKTPLPFLYFAVKSFIERKEYHYILLCVISVVGGIFYNDRVFDLLAIIMIIGFTQSYEGLSNKKIWLFIIAGHLLINILSFIKTGLC